MTSRPLIALLMTVGLATSLAACTGTPETPKVEAVAPATEPVMIKNGNPTTTSINLSKALVKTSPAAVLASEDSAAAGYAAAQQVGIPLLLVPNGADQAATTALTDELKRLEVKEVLALGKSANTLANTLKSDDLTVVTDAAKLSKLVKAPAPKGLAVFTTTAVPDPKTVAKSTLAPANAAAAGTATALGLTVLSTPSGDPRSTGASVTEIAKSKPKNLIAVGSKFGTAATLTERVASAETGVQLPGGGQTIAPGKLYVALYGHPGAGQLGVLGEQDLDGAIARAKKVAAPYEKLTKDTVIPTFEIIVSVATGGAGADGDYSNEVDPAYFKPWVEKAEKEGIYVILDLQPGNDDLVDQAKRYESLLAHSNVGLAIDPEWKLKPGQKHLTQIGQVNVEEVNRVSDWLATFTREKKLPQKAFVVHQFQTRMIIDRPKLVTDHDELQTIIHVDGSGGLGAKQSTYAMITADAPKNVVWGWKNFYDEDTPMINPEKTMEQKPLPTMISYQ